MKTYVYTESLSVKRGTNKHIRVYRIKNNQPYIIGTSDHNTASWRGARAQAMCIMHEVDGLPWAENEEHYQLRDLLGFAAMYKDKGHPRNAVRLLSIGPP